MDLGYRIEDSPGKPQVVRIEFDPPLRSHKEEDRRLHKMKAEAEKALNPVRHSSAPDFLPSPVLLFPSCHFCILLLPERALFVTATALRVRFASFRSKITRITITAVGDNSDYALRGAERDPDERLLSPPPDIHHEHAATLDVLLLVARAHAPLHFPECALSRRVGVRLRHGHLGGRVCGLFGAQTPDAVAHRGAWSFLYFDSVAAEPDFVVLQLAWVSFATIFGMPVLTRLDDVIHLATSPK